MFGSHGIRTRLYGYHIVWVLVNYTYDKNAFATFSNCISNEWAAGNLIIFVTIGPVYLGWLVICSMVNLVHGRYWLLPNGAIVIKACRYKNFMFFFF